MTNPSPAELQRWSEEVARDPGAASFVYLAEAYRRQGRREAALRVCLRGLGRHPTHVGAHALLGRLYLERGERERAADEWSVVLRLDPHDFEAHRGLGFFSLERGDLGSAERHLGRAQQLRPGDRTVAAAAELLHERQASAGARADGDGRDGSGPAPASPPQGAAASQASGADPGRLFESLAVDAPFRGALLLDDKGLVLAGRLGRGASADVLGARLGPVIEEASRTAMHVGIGAWSGLFLETPQATLHLVPLDGAYIVVLVSDPGAPPGWVTRAGERARAIARRFLEV